LGLFSFSFSLSLCASLMSRLALNIMLLQRLGIFCIVLILIYFLYQKRDTNHVRSWTIGTPSDRK
jgi:hypothetical protein